MVVNRAAAIPMAKIEKYPYKGKPLPVKEVWISWLSKVGPDGSPEYGLRYFTVGPGGEIPIHNHLYYQTMYILQGHLLAKGYDFETDKVVEEKELGPGDFIFLKTMEPHSLHNTGSEPAVFLCCIANVYEESSI